MGGNPGSGTGVAAIGLDLDTVGREVWVEIENEMH